MKNLITISLVLFLSINLLGQENVIEPEFIGESYIIQNDSSILNLEKETVKVKTKLGATVYIVGIGKAKTRIDIEKCCSGVRTSTKTNLKIVVRAVDNNTDPLSIINLFKFQKRKKDRRAELSSTGTFSGRSDNNLDYVKFTGKKYGNSSYVLTVSSIEPGEYGITVKNPNNLDEKSLIVSTFGAD